MPTSKHPKVPLPAGSHRNQCPSCGVLFGGFIAFDRHRVGSFNNPANPRRCRTESELVELGLWKRPDGVYSQSIDKDRSEQLKEAHADSLGLT